MVVSDANHRPVSWGNDRISSRASFSESFFTILWDGKLRYRDSHRATFLSTTTSDLYPRLKMHLLRDKMLRSGRFDQRGKLGIDPRNCHNQWIVRHPTDISEVSIICKTFHSGRTFHSGSDWNILIAACPSSLLFCNSDPLLLPKKIIVPWPICF